MRKGVMRQYFETVADSGCRATRDDDPACTCWHDEGAGPSPLLRDGDPLRQWRDKPDDGEQPPVEGVKHDASKPPLHLLPPDALYAITEILDFGAKKYAPRNWEKGMDWSRVYRAAIGHLFKWWMRAGPDEETGKSHLWHAGCCILFLISYELRNVGKDDRP